MISKIISWVKSNKLVTALAVAVVYLLLTRSFSKETLLNKRYELGSLAQPGIGRQIYPDSVPTPPAPQVEDRKVVTTSNASVLVKNVLETIEKIKQKTVELKGYMVSTNINDNGYASSGYISVRLPLDKRDEFIKFIRSASVRVVSEYITSTDITDRFIDIQARLSQLEKTKARFEEILAKAQNTNEIMQVQNQIMSLQDQIDSYTGQLKYMEGVSSTTLITVNLSTDELALPYTPQAPWKPQAIFKQAVRSLVSTLQKTGTAGIYLGVYSVVIVPLAVIFFGVKKVLKKRPSVQPQ